MGADVYVPIALFVLSTFCTITGYLLVRTLKGIDRNQDNLAKFLEGSIQRVEERQDKLEDDQKKTAEKVDTLIGQHEMVISLGGHKN